VQVGESGERDVQAVYVGWYPDCTMKGIEAACEAIWAGAQLYVASDVPFFATKQGRTMGYSYAIVGAIRRVTRAPMILTGKPSLHALRFVARRLGVRCRDLGIVGDDPSVEIIMARRGGAKAFAVTTGIMAREEWERQSGLRRPERVLRRLGDMLEYLPKVPSGIRESVRR
jgi:ribonucleotide monophosphatase NagD (HAD superfamily)